MFFLRNQRGENSFKQLRLSLGGDHPAQLGVVTKRVSLSTRRSRRNGNREQSGNLCCRADDAVVCQFQPRG